MMYDPDCQIELYARMYELTHRLADVEREWRVIHVATLARDKYVDDHRGKARPVDYDKRLARLSDYAELHTHIHGAMKRDYEVRKKAYYKRKRDLRKIEADQQRV